MSAIGNDLRAAIDRVVEAGAEEQEQILQALVACRSENPNLVAEAGRREAAEQERRCQQLMAAELRSLGMAVDTWEVAEGRVNVVGTRIGASDDAPSLLLNGHVDVVPAGPPAAWPHAPWSGRVEDGRMWGRGTSDMKGGLVAAVGALRALERLGIRLAGTVAVHSVVDEEVGGLGTRRALERGHRADAAIVLEPTSGQHCPVEGGLEWFDLVVTGVAGHSAQRYRSIHAGGRGPAVNAIEKAHKLIAAIAEYERYRGNTASHPLLPLGITTINPGVIIGGSGRGPDGMPGSIHAYSNMADYCRVGYSMKYLPSERADDVKRELEAYVASVAAADPWLRDHPPVIEWGVGGVSMPPCETPLDHPFLQVVARAAEDQGDGVHWAGFEAKTDLTWITAAGIPGLVYGPGSIDQAHGASEYLELSELARATRVLAQVILDWCGAAGDAAMAGGAG